MNPPVHLDYNATTPIDPRVLGAMRPWLGAGFGNPSSDHAYGRQAQAAVAQARAQVAALIAAQPGEILFTGCATEANNLAILGAARALSGRGRHDRPAIPMERRAASSAPWVWRPSAPWVPCALVSASRPPTRTSTAGALT